MEWDGSAWKKQQTLQERDEDIFVNMPIEDFIRDHIYHGYSDEAPDSVGSSSGNSSGVDPRKSSSSSSTTTTSNSNQERIRNRYLAIVNNEEGKRFRKNQTYQKDDRFYIYKSYDLTKYYGTVLYQRNYGNDRTLGRTYRVQLDDDPPLREQNMFAVNMFKVDENEEETTYSEDEREYDRGGGYSDESSNMPTTTTSNSNTMSSSDNNQGTPRPKFNIHDMVYARAYEKTVEVIDRYLDETRDGNNIWMYRVEFDAGDVHVNLGYLRESDLMEVPANSGSSSSTTTTTTTTTTSGGDGSSSRGSSRSSKKRRLEDVEKKVVIKLSMNNQCPICLNNFNHIFEDKGKIFSAIKSDKEADEIKEVVILNCCGNLIHKECLDDYIASKAAYNVTNVRCPLYNHPLVINNNGLVLEYQK